MTTEQFLLRYIADAWLAGESAELRVDTPLLVLNVISSADIFDLVHGLQAEFDISIPLQEITPENFQSITAIASLVDRFRESERRNVR